MIARINFAGRKVTLPVSSAKRFDISFCYLKSTSSSTQENSTEEVHKRISGDARDIFQHAVDSVLPASMVKRNLEVRGDMLVVGEGDKVKEFPLNKNVHIVAFGKAVVGMVTAAEHVLREHVRGGIASIPANYTSTFKSLGKPDLLPTAGSKVEFYEGAAKNLADDDAYATALKVTELARHLGAEDIMLTLITGGGSSLLACPLAPVSVDELREVSRLMSTSGASIDQMNVVRKQLEVLKGGGLARIAAPATTISLVLSDVIGDCLDTIASGPTVRDYSSPEQCFELFDRLGITEKVPTNVIKLLHEKRMKYSAVGGTEQEELPNAYNFIVGSNTVATDRAAERAAECGYLSYVLSRTVSEEATSVGHTYALLCRFICRVIEHKQGGDSRQLMQLEIQLIQAGVTKDKINDLCAIAEKSVNTGRAVCIVCGGEPVVTVRGSGIGGRNQEMVLSFALHMDARRKENMELANNFGIVLFSAGTDGIDGPCPAAGAIVTPNTVAEAVQVSLDSQAFLENNDSYNFFTRLNNGANHVVTGHTGTNVMDVHILMISPLSGPSCTAKSSASC